MALSAPPGPVIGPSLTRPCPLNPFVGPQSFHSLSLAVNPPTSWERAPPPGPLLPRHVIISLTHWSTRPSLLREAGLLPSTEQHPLSPVPWSTRLAHGTSAQCKERAPSTQTLASSCSSRGTCLKGWDRAERLYQTPARSPLLAQTLVQMTYNELWTIFVQRPV